MPASPLSAALDLQRAGLERATELLEDAEVAPERAEQFASVDVGTTPSEVVYEENKLRLLHYEPRTDEQHDVPILVVYALINRPYILDLQPDRSVVRTLLERGFDVYLIDWGEPSLLDNGLTLEDYVVRYVDNCVDVVRERAGLDAINVLGYCMGGTMSAMYAALFPEKVRNLALMAAGLYFEDTGGVLELWGEEPYYEPSAVAEAFGNVPSEFLDAGFALMDPVDNFLTKYVRLAENLDNEDFVKNFARMERWLGDGIDVAGDAYVEFLEDIYQDNKLYRNELYLGDRHVDIERITMPVLQIVGEYDHLIPPESSVPFNEAVPSEDTDVMRMRSGHIGLSVSSSSHAELWPDVGDWFVARSELDEEETEPAGEEAAGAEEEAVGAETAEEATGAEEESVGAEEAELAEEPAGAESTEEETAAEAEAPAAGADLTAVEGVGPAYAERLRAAGVETVDELAGADAAALADATGVAEGRVRSMVEAAGEVAAAEGTGESTDQMEQPTDEAEESADDGE